MLLLFVILVLVLSIPNVQTALGNYATKKLNNSYKTNINIGGVGLQFNGDVELKNILIKDFKQDTLISASELNTSILSISNLMQSKLNFGDIDTENLKLNIVTYKGYKNTSLDVFVERFEEDNPSSNPSAFLMSSSDVSIYKGEFKYIDYNKEIPEILQFSDLDINATNFLIRGANVDMRVNTLSFKDSRGLVVQNLSTNFSYTLSKMNFGDLKVKTKESYLAGGLKFKYKREDFKYFLDKVNVEAYFINSKISTNDLNIFYNEFGKNKRINVASKFSGTLNNLVAKNLKLSIGKHTKIVGDVRFKNIFNVEENNFVMQGGFSNLTSNYKQLKSLLPNVLGASIPEIFDKLGHFTLVGETTITSQEILANFNVETVLGFFKSNLLINKIDDINNATYKGNIILDEFDLGTFVGDPLLDKISLNLDVNGFGFKKENINTSINGSIYDLVYNKYSYKAISVKGKLKEKVFDGHLVSKDTNLKLTFNGLADFSKTIYDFDFVAQVDYMNLKALNIPVSNSKSQFKGRIDMKVKGTDFNDAEGNIAFTKTIYENEIDTYKFNDFKINSSFKVNNRNITERIIKVNSPDIVTGELKGVFKLEDIAALFENSLKSIYTKFIPNSFETKQYANFNFKIYNKIVEVFYPEIKLGKNTFIKGRVETDEKAFKLSFKSPEIKFEKYFAKQIELKVENDNPLFNTYVEVDSINTKYYNASKFNLINVTLNDTLFMRSEFKGGKRNKDIFNLTFYHTIAPDSLSVLGFKKSDITFKGHKWILNNKGDKHNKVAFDSDFKNISIDKFEMSHNAETIRFSGAFKDSTYKDLKLNLKDVDLQKITPDVDSLSLAGNVNGRLNIKQARGTYLPSSSIVIDGLEVNKQYLGNFEADIVGDSNLTKYNINAQIKNKDIDLFSALGSLNVASKNPTIDLKLYFDTFGLRLLNPFLSGVFNNIRGDVFGTVNVVGDLNKPDFNGELKVNNGGMGVNLLEVDYAFKNQASVTLNKQRFVFNAIGITDTTFNTKGEVNGSISHTNFDKWNLDIGISTDRLVVLNTKETPDALYYGTGFVGGEARVTGPTESIRINVIAETKAGTVFKIPLNDNESFGDNSFIHFLSPEEKIAKKEGRSIAFNEAEGLQLDFDLDVTNDAEIEIVIDKSSGSTIKGRGNGGMLININTNGEFDMFGDFVVYEGSYKFLYAGLVEKNFTVIPFESTLAWNGDPLDALINIKAKYETSANPSALLDNPINQSIPVNLEIDLTGQLEQPIIDYQFKFPNVGGGLKSELQYRLGSKEENEKQALFFLATGSFNRAIGDLTLTGTLTERLNSLVNNLLSSSDSKFKVGLNYQAGQNRPDLKTDDRFGVSVKAKIVDGILFNGKLGVPIGGSNETAIAGDAQVDFLLNEEGTLSAKVFNKENTIKSFGEEIGYTQGVGLSYQVEFNTLGELVDKIFKSKKRIEKERLEREQKDKLKQKQKAKNDSLNTSSAFGFKTKKETKK